MPVTAAVMVAPDAVAAEPTEVAAAAAQAAAVAGSGQAAVAAAAEDVGLSGAAAAAEVAVDARPRSRTPPKASGRGLPPGQRELADMRPSGTAGHLGAWFAGMAKRDRSVSLQAAEVPPAATKPRGADPSAAMHSFYLQWPAPAVALHEDGAAADAAAAVGTAAALSDEEAACVAGGPTAAGASPTL